MEFSFAEEMDRPGIDTLWRMCFGAGTDYLSLYYSTRYHPEEVLVCRIGGQPAAMLSLLPCVYRMNGRDYSCRYIFAVATHPEQRGNGLCTKLLETADRIMTAQGISLSVLAPAENSLFAFYRSRGYEDWFFQTDLILRPGGEQQSFGVSRREVPVEEYACRRNAFLEAMPGGTDALVWDQDALRFPEGESRMDGGGLFSIAWEGGEGLSCLYRGKGSIVVKELLAPPGQETTAAEAVSQLFPDQEIQCRLPAVGQGRCIGMANWLSGRPEAPSGRGYLSFILD